MTIRWKLHCSVIALVAIFLVAAGLSLRAVRGHGEYMRAQARMRTQSQQTADIRAAVYQHLAAREQIVSEPADAEEQPWPRAFLDDIQVQIRLAEQPAESRLWLALHQTIADWAESETQSLSQNDLDSNVQHVERDLRNLRNYYDMQQSMLAASGARTGFVEYGVLILACGLTVLIFLIYLLMTRDWLVKPIETLRVAVNTIGRGDLTHRVPLEGGDELTDLARGIEGMADQLADRQEALAEARELSAIGELCGNVAHGLRNPLAAIRASAQLAERRLQGQGEAEALMQTVTEQADRMDQRISKLFDFSRKVLMQKVATRFGDLADAAVARVQPLLSSRQVQCTINDRTSALEVQADRDQMIEVLAELISNAAHHAPSDSQVTVTCQPLAPENGSASGLRIEVADDGTGMDESTARKAFDPFFTSRPAGIGMGLALVQRIVQRHGGNVSITSAIGEGTTVRIDLPRDDSNQVSR